MPRPADDAVTVPRAASPAAMLIVTAVGELVAATLREDRPSAEAILGTVGQRRVDLERRQSVSTAVKVAIHRRDHWTCRYCSARTVAPPVLRFLSEIYPTDFPYHPNWKAGQVDAAYLLVSASLDHEDPGGRGGSWRSERNLVTACWPCNTGKADLRLEEVGWQLLAEDHVHSNWDGLSATVDALWQRAGRPDILRDWRRALAAT